MQHKARIILVSLVFLVIIGNIAIYEKYNTRRPEAADTGATGNTVVEDGVHLNPDRIEIQKNDLKSCCTFMKDGKEQNCYVLKRFDCSYCEKYC